MFHTLVSCSAIHLDTITAREFAISAYSVLFRGAILRPHDLIYFTLVINQELLPVPEDTLNGKRSLT